jgi:hypothetical protein
MTESNGHESNGGGSALDWLRQRHAELAVDRSMDYEVPGYSGRLVLRLGPAQWRAVAKAQNLQTDDDGQTLLIFNSDVIIGATRAVLVRDDDGALASLDAENDAPVRIDSRLADLLATGTHSARETLWWLFPNEIAIGLCAGELLTWTSNVSTEIASDFVSR